MAAWWVASVLTGIHGPAALAAAEPRSSPSILVAHGLRMACAWSAHGRSDGALLNVWLCGPQGHRALQNAGLEQPSVRR